MKMVDDNYTRASSIAAISVTNEKSFKLAVTI